MPFNANAPMPRSSDAHLMSPGQPDTTGYLVQTGPFAARTRARYALFIEGAGDAKLLAPLLAQRAVFVDFTVALLTAVGARSPEAAARTLMAASDGLVLHRVTIDPDAEIRPVIERAVRACLD